jgi:mannose-6-phosphate isomerase-like protein (cupin superfamily)
LNNSGDHLYTDWYIIKRARSITLATTEEKAMTTKIKQEANAKTDKGTNFAAIHAGPFSGLDDYKLEVPALNRTVRGKLFVRDFLGLTGMQISMNKLPAGGAVPFYHKHKENEEVYLFIRGKGQMQIDGQIIDVEEGSVVRIGTNGNRTLRNNSTEDLQYICIQAKENSLQIDTFDDGVRDEKPVEWTSSH